MLVKLYALIWLLGLLTVTAFYLTGNLGPVARVAFGFMSFGAVFMGMLGVLPHALTHQTTAKH